MKPNLWMLWIRILVQRWGSAQPVDWWSSGPAVPRCKL